MHRELHRQTPLRVGQQHGWQRVGRVPGTAAGIAVPGEPLYRVPKLEWVESPHNYVAYLMRQGLYLIRKKTGETRLHDVESVSGGFYVIGQDITVEAAMQIAQADFDRRMAASLERVDVPGTEVKP